MVRRFVVARNPDPESTLPYLLNVPIGSGLLLKARDTWPRTSRVYCHRLEAWPADAEVVEEIPVIECRRRGIAIDLLLDRKREFRSQFVITRMAGGREAIFWQTRKVATTARPGARIPGRRISDLRGGLTVVVDTRERYAFRFAKQQASVVRATLSAGDYAIRDADGQTMAAVERKTIGDLAGSLNNGSLAFELAQLGSLPRAAIVVEDRYSALLKLTRVPAGYLPDLLARVQVRYPDIPIVFAETRPLAEEWTYRWLGAVLAESIAVGDAWGDEDDRPAADLTGEPLETSKRATANRKGGAPRTRPR